MKEREQRGVTVLETALIISVCFIFTLSIVDIARFLMLEAILNKAAEDGLNVATKIPNFDYDVRDLALDDSRYYDFYEARRRVLEAATRLPLNTFFTPPGTPSDAELLAFEHIDTEVGGAIAGAPPSITRAAAVLRPGEIAFQKDNPTKYIVNVRKPPDSGNLLPAPPWSMRNGLRNNPIHLELRARVRALCPAVLCPWFSGERILVGRALGWRENSIPHGPLPPENPAEMPAGFASASTSTTVTVGLAPVTTVPPADPNLDWSEAFNKTDKKDAPVGTWCAATPWPVRCSPSR